MEKYFYLFIIFLTLNFNQLFSNPDSLQIEKIQKSALKVYINCSICDLDYLREKLQYVNYVRIEQEADVYILSTYQTTASGGKDYSIFFIGQNIFEGQNDTLHVITASSETWDEKRVKSTQIIKLGLMKYVAKTDLAEFIKIDFDFPIESQAVEDYWKLWYFKLSSNIYATGEKSYRTLSLWSSFSASKITPDWKVEFNLNNDYSGSWYEIDDTTTVTSENMYYGFNNLIVKSLGEHWSIGESVDLSSSEYRNIKFNFSFKPSVEYNVFPFSESTRRQFRFLYGIGFSQNYYNDSTIYLKMKELLFEHSLKVGFEQIEPWGSFYLSSKWSNYLHNFKYNNLNFYTSISWRIFKGFSLNLSGGLDLIHNQMSLPKTGATLEEILTRQRILESQYNYWISGGISYSFGSIFNNIVNPRFDF